MGGEKQKTKNGRGAGSPGSRAVPVEKKIRNNNNNFSEISRLSLHSAGQAVEAL